MFTFLLILQSLVTLGLIIVILLQRSEGGGLGVGGSSAGFMTARGAADFLSRATAWLGGAFVILCIVLAAVAGTRADTQKIDASVLNAPIPTGTGTAPANPSQTLAPDADTVKPNNQVAPDNGAVPLAQ
jgi:preprotein translocase subunit SecG